MMPSMIPWIVCIVYGLLIGPCSGAVTMEMSITEPSAPGTAHHIGSNVTILCSVRGGHIGLTVYWYKVVMSANGQDLKDLLATNTNLAPRYEQLPRFHYTMVNLGETVHFILNIYGLQRDDSGHYQCSTPSADNAYATASMEVYSPPVDITFDGYADGDIIYFTEGAAERVSCRVTDALPTPDITITIGSIDITEQFQQSSELEIRCTGTESECPLHFTYHYALTKENVLATYQHDGALLTCTASLPGSNLPPVQTALRVMVNYAPRIQCESEQLVQIGGMHDITCTVQAQPRPTLAQWRFLVAGKEYTVYPKEPSADGDYEAHYKEMDPQSWEYSLRIQQVKDDNIAEYHVTVENDYGITEDSVLLEQDMSLPVLSSCSPMIASIITLFSALLILILLAYL